MAIRRGRRAPTRRTTARAESSDTAASTAVSSSTEQLLLAALERGGDTLETGRFLVTYREGMAEEGAKALRSRAFRMADALMESGVPFVFVTGYDHSVIPDRFASTPRFSKPADLREVVRAVAALG